MHKHIHFPFCGQYVVILVVGLWYIERGRNQNDMFSAYFEWVLHGCQSTCHHSHDKMIPKVEMLPGG